jgi:transketolase N-terminal domain/subunit
MANRSGDIMDMLLIAVRSFGGPLGMSDMFTALYFNRLNIIPSNPYRGERDYLFYEKPAPYGTQPWRENIFRLKN